MFKNHGLVNNLSSQNQLNPRPGLNVTYAIQPQPFRCRSGWCIEATQPKPVIPFHQGNPRKQRPGHRLLTPGEAHQPMTMIGINRLVMIGRSSAGLSTVRPAIKVR